jgi:hypothetical protein
MSTTGLSGPLRADNWTVELHKDVFVNEGEKPDHEWIPIVTGRGLVVISSDKNMGTWRAEQGRVREAIERCCAKVFFLRGAPDEQVKAIRAARNAIARHVKRCAGTFLIARIHGPGSRLGEVQILNQGGSNKAERKFGVKVRSESMTT